MLTQEDRTKLCEVARSRGAFPNVIAEIAMGTEKQICSLLYRLSGKTLQEALLETPLPEKYIRIKETDMGHRIYIRENGTDRLLDSTFFIYYSDCVLWAERLAKANKLEFIQ